MPCHTAKPLPAPNCTNPNHTPQPTNQPLNQVLQQGSQAPRLLALEVTYHPAAMLSAATPLLQELAEHIISAVGPPTGSGPGQAGT